MKMFVCAAYDAAVKAYTQPMFFRSVAEAIRGFQDAVVAEGSQFGRHAADYHFSLLGEFDDNDGSFVQAAAPTRLVTALELADPFPADRKVQ